MFHNDGCLRRHENNGLRGKKKSELILGRRIYFWEVAEVCPVKLMSCIEPGAHFRIIKRQPLFPVLTDVMNLVWLICVTSIIIILSIKPAWCTIFLSMFISFLYMFSGEYVPIIRRNNCIYVALDVCHSVWTTVWYAGALFVPDSHSHRVTVSHT
jgi:hypothetical protein